MGLTLAGVQLMGTPFACYLSEYVRTIVYRVPGFIVRQGNPPPMIVHDVPGFRAAIVTDPVRFLLADSVSNQYNTHMNLRNVLRAKCAKDLKESESHIFVVIRVKEDLHCFAAVHGQCVRREHEGIEILNIVDNDEAPTPCPDERTSTTHAVLSAIRIEFEITEGMEKLFDARCYRTDDGRWLSWIGLTMKANLSRLESSYTRRLGSEIGSQQSARQKHLGEH